MRTPKNGTRSALFVTIGALLAVGLLAAQPRGQTAPASGVRAFVGARVLASPGAAPIDNGVIVVRNGRVEAVGAASAVRPPTGAETTNLAGKFVIPGLVSAHAHVSDVDGLKPRAYTTENTLRQLALFARYGITTVWSLGGEQAPAFAARDAQSTPALDRARLYLSGDVIAAATPEAAREAVTKVAALKPDVIKIRVDDNLGTTAKMSPAVYKAIIDEAHTRGLRVSAHIFYLEDAKDLLRSGVDMIAHSVRDWEIDAEFTDLMKARNVPYCPTLTREISTFVYESTPDFFTDPFFLREADPAVVAQLREPGRQAAMRASTSAQRYKAGLEVAKRNLKRASDAGVRIVMGTDAGPSPERFVGYFEHVEMAMMAEAGLTPVRVLQSATADAADAVRSGGGRIAAGGWADFVVLDRDPLVDIRNSRTISSVWIAGNQVRR